MCLFNNGDTGFPLTALLVCESINTCCKIVECYLKFQREVGSTMAQHSYQLMPIYGPKCKNPGPIVTANANHTSLLFIGGTIVTQLSSSSFIVCMK